MNKKKILFPALFLILTLLWLIPALTANAEETEKLTSTNVTLSATSFVYNSKVQKPAVTVKNAAGTLLTADTDYSVAYSAESKYPGTFTLTVTGKGYYSGSVKRSYTITKQPIDASRVTLAWTQSAYNGTVQQPAVTVKNAAGGTLTLDSSYTVAYSEGSKAPGTYTVTVTAKGSCYSGTAEKTYKITKQAIDASRVTLSWTEAPYNSAVQKPTVTVKNKSGYAMTQDSSYTVSYSAGSKAPGDYTVTVTGKGYYTGSATVPYTITRQPVDASRVILSWTSSAYNSKVQKPSVTVKNATGGTMKPDLQYTVSYSADSKAPGTYTVTVTGVGYFIGTASKTYTITKQPLDASRVTLSWTEATYNSKVQKPEVVSVKSAGGGTMTLNSSYTYSYSADSKAPGSYTVSVTGKGYYTGTVTVPYTIKKQPVDASRVTLAWTDAPYNGAVQQPEVVSVKSAGGGTMTLNSSYTVSYSAESKDPGSYTVSVTGKGYYTGTATLPYTITEQPLDESCVTLSWTEKPYNGAIQKPAVTVRTASGAALTANTDYTVSYSADSKAPGDYTVTVTGAGEFSGSATVPYTITRQEIAASRVTLSWTTAAYSGKAQHPTVTVKNASGGTMKPDLQYTVSYSAESKIPGNYTVTVTGVGYFIGTAEISYTITKQPLDASRVTLSADEFVFNGSVQQPAVTVKSAAGGTMTLNSSYTLSYSAASVDPGTYTVTATGKGYYTGSVTKEYTILPQIALTDGDIALSATCFRYDGTVKQPEITVTSGGKTLTAGEDYTLAYSGDCVENGTYTVTATGVNRYTGTANASFTISESGHTPQVIPAVAPTCTEPGNEEGSVCAVCGTVITEPAAIPALGHDMEKIDEKEVTCTEDGNNEYYVCLRCELAFTDEAGENETTVAEQTIAATGHEYIWVHMPASCTAKAFREKRCDNCDMIFETIVDETTVELGHEPSVYSPPTCTEGGYDETNCQRNFGSIETYAEDDETLLYTQDDMVCGFLERTYREGEPALGHTCDANSDWTETVAATCLAGGVEATTCTRCGGEYTRETEALGHVSQLDREADPAPTCTEPGLAKYTCSRCGEIVKQEELPASHDFVLSKRIAAGCTETGLDIKECSNCSIPLADLAVGDLVKTSVRKSPIANKSFGTIAAINDDGTYTLDFTIIGKDGQTGVYAANEFTTATTLLEVVPATGHSVSTFEVVQEWTCTQDGKFQYTGVCENENCGENLTGAVVTLPAKGHSIDPNAYPTCTEPVKCSRCQAIDQAALGHDFTVPGCVLSAGAVNGFYCRRCSVTPVTTDDKAATLTNLMNLVKSNGYCMPDPTLPAKTVASVNKAKMSTSYTKFDFGIYTSIVKNMYESEVSGVTVDYDPLETSSIRNLFPHMYSATSIRDGLGEGDLDNFKIERISGFNTNSLIAGFDEAPSAGSAPDLSAYANRTVGENVIKVTLDMKNEVYSKDPAINNVNSESRMNGGVKTYLYDTHISKVFDYDIRKVVDNAGYAADTWTITEGGGEEGYEMTMKLNSLKADAKATYYFAADDYEPIAATFHITETMDQDLTMNVLSVNGEIKPIISTERDYVYFFTGYFNG